MAHLRQTVRLGGGDAGFRRLSGLKLLQPVLLIAGLFGEGADAGLGQEAPFVQLAADVMFAARPQKVVAGLIDLGFAVQAVALQAQILRRGVAQLADDLGLAGQNLQLQLGVGQDG